VGQHTVPQRHLERFQDPDRPGFIWQHDRRGGKPKQVSIEKAVQQKGFYGDDMERFLADSIELPANNVIEKLIAGSGIDEEERRRLAAYAGTMLLRVPFHRRWVRTLVPDALTAVVTNLRSQIAAMAADGLLAPDMVERRMGEIARAEDRFKLELPEEALAQVNNPLPSPAIVKALYDMTWRLLESREAQYFITTDNPAFFFRAKGYGLGNAESEFCLPLSARFALHGCWQRSHSALVHVAANQRVVREINRRLVSEAVRLAFYHASAPWLLSLLRKENLFLSRIDWGGR
jgi:hypothetical protein